MKVTATDLCEIFENAWARGVADGRREVEQRVAESTRALLDENSRLKSELSRQDTRLMAKAQTDSFPAVRKEQNRIATGIVKCLPQKTAMKLLTQLALGDLL